MQQSEFGENRITIAMSSSDYYAPYLSVVIQSIMDHMDSNFYYEIFVFTKDMSKLNRECLLSMISDCNNISIKFMDVKLALDAIDGQFDIMAHFTIESFFRSFMPYMLPDRKKIIYCDCDLIWLQDPSRLFKIDLQDNIFAGTIDSIFLYNQANCGDYWKTYNTNVLGISENTPYVNTGVMLWNIELFRELFSLEYVLQLGMDGHFLFCDQDVFNVICEGNILFLDPRWNAIADSMKRENELLRYLGLHHLDDIYVRNREEAFICHWADVAKPWNTEIIDCGYLFWKYARKSPFYERILFRKSYESFQAYVNSKKYAVKEIGRI